MSKPRLSSKKMRRVMYEWHCGKWSPLYAAASSGLVADMEALQREIRKCARHCENPAEAPFAEPAKNRDEAVYLRKLADALPVLFTKELAINGTTYKVLPWF